MAKPAITWTWADLGLVGAVWGLLALGALYIGLVLLADLRRLVTAKAPIAGSTWLGAVAPFLVAVVLARWGYEGARQRHLQRGEWHYTVAHIYENTHFKGSKESRFEFWVHGQRYTYDEQVDWQGGWQPLGSRWYLRFAVPDPNLHERIGRPVPATITQVPAAGWASLPATH
jgi:hypothetical protein